MDYGSEAQQEIVSQALATADFTPAAICLLYTSDAADERSSVDLGGRRIIKKKKSHDSRGWRYNKRAKIDK